MNLIRCQLADTDGNTHFLSEQGQIRLDLPFEMSGRAPSTPSALLGIRCEHLYEDPSGPIPARVLTEEYFGSARLVHVDTPCGRMILRTEATSGRALGAQLRLRLDPSQVSVFDAATEARL
jgi:ABC-type sugar transport system ATPase subunit